MGKGAQRSPAHMSEAEEKTTADVLIGGYLYDVASFKHPGGSIVKFLTNNGDATEAFEEFHGRSKKAQAMLRSLPKVAAPRDVLDARDEVLAPRRVAPRVRVVDPRDAAAADLRPVLFKMEARLPDPHLGARWQLADQLGVERSSGADDGALVRLDSTQVAAPGLGDHRWRGTCARRRVAQTARGNRTPTARAKAASPPLRPERYTAGRRP